MGGVPSTGFVTGIILPVRKHTTAVVGSPTYDPYILLFGSTGNIYEPVVPSKLSFDS